MRRPASLTQNEQRPIIRRHDMGTPSHCDDGSRRNLQSVDSDRKIRIVLHCRGVRVRRDFHLSTVPAELGLVVMRRIRDHCRYLHRRQRTWPSVGHVENAPRFPHPHSLGGDETIPEPNINHPNTRKLSQLKLELIWQLGSSEGKARRSRHAEEGSHGRTDHLCAQAV